MTGRRPIVELLSAENPVLRHYAFWSSMLILKMLMMTLLTAAQRLRTKVRNCTERQTLANRIVYVLVVGQMPAALGLSVFKRIYTKTFANPEDLKLRKAKEVCFDEPHVERVRRAHRNDLENILPFILIALIYVLTDPNALCAGCLFRVVFGCRLVHTIVYAVYVVPQPARAIAFFVPMGITMYMAVQSAIVFFVI